MKRKTAFTKTDLVAVIGCTLFLLANLGAVGSSGRRRAKETVCLSNLHKWGVVWKMFLEDRGGRTPEHMGWWGPMWNYYKDEKLLLCPSAEAPPTTLPPGGPTDPDNIRYRGGKFKAWASWYDPDPGDWRQGDPEPLKWYLGSYGFNYWFTRDTGGGRYEDRLWGYYPGSLLAVKGAHSVPVLVDAATGGFCPMAKDFPPQYDGQIYFSMPMNINEIRSCCIDRHGGAVNAVFLDFSARKVGLKELWVLRWHRKWTEEINEIGLPAEFYDPEHWMYNFKNYDYP